LNDPATGEANKKERKNGISLSRVNATSGVEGGRVKIPKKGQWERSPP